jgi:hypothetical protein
MSVQAFALFSETEPNNTRATADMVLYSRVAPWADVGVLTLTPNDSDFFKIRLNAGDWLTAITFPIQSNYFVPDTVMALFDASGDTAIVFNDDAGDGYGSAIRWQADATGDYFIAITGFHPGAQNSLELLRGHIPQRGRRVYSDRERGASARACEHAGARRWLAGLVGLRRRNRK